MRHVAWRGVAGGGRLVDGVVRILRYGNKYTYRTMNTSTLLCTFVGVV